MILLLYIFKNVLVRWRTSSATVGCIALVTAVCLVLQMMAEGISSATAVTGSPDNMLIVRKGSTAESSSQITPEQVGRVKYAPEIEKGAGGQPLFSADLIVLVNLERRGGKGEANVCLRGLTPEGVTLRSQAQLLEGRWFQPGKREVVVSQKMAARFVNLGLGEHVKTGRHTLRVVGLFDGEKTSFDSEVWMDANEARSLFERENYSSILVRVSSPERQESLQTRLENDKVLRLRAQQESAYYAAQTSAAAPIRFLGYFLAVAMSVGSVFAAMNTMYAAVGRRTREVGTLRVLGFPRRVILVAFVAEGVSLAVGGGALGCLVAAPFQWLTASAFSMESFNELVYQLRLTPALVVATLSCAALVGAVGSFLPALRAARTPVISALKSL